MWGQRMQMRFRLAIVSLVFLMMLAGGMAMIPRGSEGATWSPSVPVSGTPGPYGTLDIKLGGSYMYVLSMAYSPSDSLPVYLFRSADGGSTWDTRTPIQYGFRAEPGMCVVSSGGVDRILLVSGDSVLMSQDNGDSFTTLSTIPIPSGALWWRFMDIFTPASIGSQDSTIYVVGSVIYNAPWINGAGPNPLGFTKSTDGGLTWSAPVIINSSVYTIYYPKVISDGTNIYIVFSRNLGTQPNYLYSDLYAVSSSDGGTTWSADTLVLARGTNSDLLWAHSLQYVGDGKALITIGDYGEWSTPNANQIGRYGWFHFSDMSFEQVGYVQDSSWNIYGGFAGALQNDGLFSVAYTHVDNATMTDTIYYTSSTNSGFTQPAEPSLIVHSHTGVPRSSYLFTATSDGSWSIRAEDHGLQFMRIEIYDASLKSMRPMSTEFIDFQDLGAYPTGTVRSAQISVHAGDSFLVIVKDPVGQGGAYAKLYDEVS